MTTEQKEGRTCMYTLLISHPHDTLKWNLKLKNIQSWCWPKASAPCTIIYLGFFISYFYFWLFLLPLKEAMSLDGSRWLVAVRIQRSVSGTQRPLASRLFCFPISAATCSVAPLPLPACSSSGLFAGHWRIYQIQAFHIIVSPVVSVPKCAIP